MFVKLLEKVGIHQARIDESEVAYARSKDSCFFFCFVDVAVVEQEYKRLVNILPEQAHIPCTVLSLLLVAVTMVASL